jgi:hypothetical protein
VGSRLAEASFFSHVFIHTRHALRAPAVFMTFDIEGLSPSILNNVTFDIEYLRYQIPSILTFDIKGAKRRYRRHCADIMYDIQSFYL